MLGPECHIKDFENEDHQRGDSRDDLVTFDFQNKNRSREWGGGSSLHGVCHIGQICTALLVT